MSDHTDERIDAAACLLAALMRCDAVYEGGLGNVPYISCDGLAAALLLIGGNLTMGDTGFPQVHIERDGVELVAEMSSSPAKAES